MSSGLEKIIEQQPKYFSSTEDKTHMIIHSRFGVLNVNVTTAIYFPLGLLGIPGELHFCIVDMPDNEKSNFKLLQCLNDHSLTFVVLPINIDNPIISKEDILESAKTLEVKLENFAALLITTVRKISNDDVSIYANARAPIMMDTESRIAVQHVLPNNKYDVKQKII